MKKLLSILIALAMVAVMTVSCSENDPPADTSNDTEAPVETPADTEEEKPVETEAQPETEDIAIEEPEAPKQPDVPCNFDEVYDLSEEIMVSEFMLEARMGMWITATDDDLMEKYITKELLEEYKYLAITYETDYVEEGYQMELLFKFHHSDDTRTEFLCDDWYQWGPAGATYHGYEFATMDIYNDGVFYVPTEQFLNHPDFREDDIIDIIGLGGVPETNTMAYLIITGVYLTK